MLASAEQGWEAVTARLAELGFEELLAVPALPAATAGARYPQRALMEPDGSVWHIRAHGTGFELLPRRWRRAGPRRCYSLGWGLRHGRPEPGLLLGQARADTDRCRRLWACVEEVLAAATEPAHGYDDTGAGACVLRFAAVLPAPPSPGQLPW